MHGREELVIFCCCVETRKSSPELYRGRVDSYSPTVLVRPLLWRGKRYIHMNVDKSIAVLSRVKWIFLMKNVHLMPYSSSREIAILFIGLLRRRFSTEVKYHGIFSLHSGFVS